jgi:NitT/TauT family transport system ATP-binding protein
MPAKIAVRDVSKSYPSDSGSLHVVDGVSFEVGDGELVALVGPSGCGKSTLMNIVAGFERADRGSVITDGELRTQPSSRGILISQHGSVFPWLTVQQNLMLGSTAMRTTTGRRWPITMRPWWG